MFETIADSIYFERVIDCYNADEQKLMPDEIDFIDDLYNTKPFKFSQKQRDVINKICEKLNLR